MNGTDFLTGSRRIRKLYEARISRVCGRYGLTQIETDILAFLSNHPISKKVRTQKTAESCTCIWRESRRK